MPAFTIEATDLEIGHGIDVMLLLVEGQKIAQRPEIGVVLDAECEVLAKISRDARRRREYRVCIRPESDIDNRIDDELIIVLTDADDRPNLKIQLGFREARCRVAELEIHPIEKFALGRVGGDEQLSDLACIRRELARVVNCKWRVKPD